MFPLEIARFIRCPVGFVSSRQDQRYLCHSASHLSFLFWHEKRTSSIKPPHQTRAPIILLCSCYLRTLCKALVPEARPAAIVAVMEFSLAPRTRS